MLGMRGETNKDQRLRFLVFFTKGWSWRFLDWVTLCWDKYGDFSRFWGDSMFVPLMTLFAILINTNLKCWKLTTQDYLNAHKKARSEVGVGPITWDSNVASYAQNYVNQLRGSCQLVHSGGQLIEINLILVTAKLFNQVAVSTSILLVVHRTQK
jgi:hypothetical protein